MFSCFQLEWFTSKKDLTPYFESIPKEVILQIFSFLDAKSLCCAARVNRYWRQLASNETIWKSLLQNFNSFNEVKRYSSYKGAYKQLHIASRENKILNRLYFQSMKEFLNIGYDSFGYP